MDREIDDGSSVGGPGSRKHNTHPSDSRMDTLVARYSRPAYQQNAFSEEEQQDLVDGVPGAPNLSLKFAMPPVAHVSFYPSFPSSPHLQLAG